MAKRMEKILCDVLGAFDRFQAYFCRLLLIYLPYVEFYLWREGYHTFF